MPQLRQGDRPYFVTLGDDQALTVTPDAGSSAIVRTYPRLLGGESTSQVVLGAGQSQRFLATPSSSRFAIEVTAGSVQYVQSLFEDAGWDGTQFTDPVKALVSKAWKVMGDPGSATAADITGYLAALSAAGGGAVLFPPSTTPWVLDDEILMASNTAILLSPGVTLQSPDPFTLVCTTTNGSPNVTVTSGDTSKLKSGYYKAQYIVGTGIPSAARVSSITDGTRFIMDQNATASGSVTLTFHYAHNIIRRSGVVNARVLALWGRATLNRNGSAAPFEFAAADAIRNCIRTENCQDVETYGVLLTDAPYHGEIGTMTTGKVRINNVRTYRNGYRGIHYHGDSPSSAIADVQMDDLELVSDGYRSYQVQTDQLNSGLFVVYDNMSRVQIGKVRVKGVPGIGVHLTGNISNGVRSGGIHYASIVCEDTGVPVALMNGLRGVTLGSVQARGKLYTFTNCTLGSGTSQLPLIAGGSGYVAGALMQSITLPAGADMTPFDIGQGVFAQDITSGLDVRMAIWSVDSANRILWVYNYASPTTRPWVIGNDGLTTVTVTIWTCRGPAVMLTGSNTNSQDMQDVHIGTLQCDTVGNKTLSATNLGAGITYISGLKIGTYSARDCYSGLHLYNFSDAWIGSATAVNSGNRRTGNDSANADFLLQNGSGATVGRLNAVSKGTGGMTRNGVMLVGVQANTSNVKIMDCVAENGNASAFAVDWAGATNVMIGDPRTAGGAALTPAGTATNGSAFKYGMT